jgi:hypothetical protein
MNPLISLNKICNLKVRSMELERNAKQLEARVQGFNEKMSFLERKTSSLPSRKLVLENQRNQASGYDRRKVSNCWQKNTTTSGPQT